MEVADISKFVGVCKDHLHAEWAIFKKSGKAPYAPVCLYGAGSSNDYPTACLESIAKGTNELDRICKENFKFHKDRSVVILKSEILVGADGSMSLHPERITRIKSKPKVESLPIPGVKKPKKPKSPETAFMGAVVQISNYMLDHAKRINEACFPVGNMKGLYLVLSSVALVKCRIVFFKEVFKIPTSNALTTVMERCNECIELMNQHILNYHSDLIRLSILHDASSSDWNAVKPYEEGEKVSLYIRMWIYYIQGLRHDLWKYTSPKMCEVIFNTIYIDTLELLLSRYSQIEPSDARLPQFRGDLNAILFLSASLLPSLVSSPRFMYECRLHNSPVFSMHRRLDLLVRVMALKSSPIDVLAKVFSDGIPKHARPSRNISEPTRIYDCPEWLTFFHDELFPARCDKLSLLPDNSAVYMTFLIAASQATPNHSLIIRGLMMRDYLGARVILKSLQNMNTKVHAGESCGGTLCMESHCKPPIIPHTVYAAIVYLVLSCSNRHPVPLLSLLMADNIKSGASFEAMDRAQVWNIQRPPWHFCLVQLVALNLGCLLSSVLEGIPCEPPAQPAHPSQLSVRLEHHLSAWTLQLIKGVYPFSDNMSYAVAALVDQLMEHVPPSIKPAGGHIISNLVMNALYSLVNSRKSMDRISPSGLITDGQWDMMQAVGERLCTIDAGLYDEHLAQMNKDLLEASKNCAWSSQTDVNGCGFEYDLPDVDDLDDYTDEALIETVCQEMADKALASVQGQHAFGLVWQFLRSNMQWIEHALDVPYLLKARINHDNSKLQLSPPMYFEKDSHLNDPLYFYDHVFYSRLDQVALLSTEFDWKFLLESDLWLPTETVCELIKQRPEMKPGAKLSLNELAAVKTLRKFMVEV